MKKAIFTLFALVLITSAISPVAVEASWWNPISWFKKSTPAVIETPKATTPQNPKVITLSGAETGIKVKLGDILEVRGIRATIAELVEDSRCPANAQCIQAGTVRVKVNAKYGILSKSVTFSLGKPFTFKGYSATLLSVSPEKIAGKAIAASDYVFTFSFSGNKNLETQKQDTAAVEQISVAKCLKDNGAIFYGAFWCPHCQAQKALFGQSAKDLPYVECSTPNGQSQTAFCTDAGISGYPTWKFPDGSVLTGEQSIETLAQKVGCPTNL